MSISSELLTLQNTKTAIRTAINNKGGSVGASDTFASYATAIDNLPSGGDDSALKDLIERDITSITIPSGTTKIGEGAFSNITSLTTVNIPSSVTLIKLNAFYGCTGLTSITIPDTVTTIETSAFNSCRNLTSCVLPNSITRITSSCFQSCGLTNISFPSSVTVIEMSSFQNCKFVNLTIPDTVTTLGNTAFQGCNQLKSVVIGTGVTNMANAVFYNCTALESVVIKATNPPTQTNAFNNTNDCPIYVPAASVDTYKAASGWSTYASRIYPIQQVATVDGNPVYNYDLGMTSTNTITSENMAKMPAGTNLELAEGITWAGGATAFSNYTNLTLPSTFTTFGDQYMLDGLTTVTSKATTPPSAERNQIGGSSLTAIYVPAASVDTYKAAGGWSNYASRIQAIPSPSITITEYEGQSVIDNAVDIGEQFGYDGDEVVVDSFAAASANSTFDSDLKAANIIVVEDDNGNDITSQCTFTSPDFSRWDSTQDPSWDGESPAEYKWRATDTIASGDSQTPGSVSITATYGALTDTLSLEYSKTDETPQPDPEEPEEPEE